MPPELGDLACIGNSARQARPDAGLRLECRDDCEYMLPVGRISSRFKTVNHDSG
jgi:hypothetical protein